jgi:hypothetical protein
MKIPTFVKSLAVLLPGTELKVPIVQKTGSAPEQVLTLLLLLPGIETRSVGL